jgi:hypothetical protein
MRLASRDHQLDEWRARLAQYFLPRQSLLTDSDAAVRATDHAQRESLSAVRMVPAHELGGVIVRVLCSPYPPPSAVAVAVRPAASTCMTYAALFLQRQRPEPVMC